jgi:hypothetical protein
MNTDASTGKLDTPVKNDGIISVLRSRLRQHTDSETEQALIRLLIGLALTIYFIGAGLQDGILTEAEIHPFHVGVAFCSMAPLQQPKVPHNSCTVTDCSK